MKNGTAIVCLLLIGVPLQARHLQQFSTDEFMIPHQDTESYTLYRYNFWATWCGLTILTSPAA
jgi:hypothetical protein